VEELLLDVGVESDATDFFYFTVDYILGQLAKIYHGSHLVWLTPQVVK
jgi:hypothetical protein